MTKDALEEEISKTLTKEKVKILSELAGKSKDSTPSLIEITFDEKTEIAFRAAWILEEVAVKYYALFLPNIRLFLQVYPEQKNHSCQRHYTKILLLLIKRNESVILDEYAESLIETSFEWLIDSETPVAVAVNCFDILFYFNKKNLWIGEELAAQIEFLMKDGSAALQSRGKKVLNKIRNTDTV
ncbi:hypothetical protein [Rubrolithibacter danxiaensis]|uniref:hypothetical protein n=1 Tax=Rubrolithibacter danxiaensis TaxID=3390805 RepID=UPI003BF8A5DB